MSELAGELANLTSDMRSATINLDIVDQQAQVIQNQGKSITDLTPLLRHTTEDIVWYEKAGGGVESVSTCSCLPRSTNSTNPSPARIEYHCGDLSNRYVVSQSCTYLSTSYSSRTFSLPCSGGVCESEAFPSCTDPMEWEEESASSVTFQNCQETPFNGDTLFCSNAGSNGTREVKIRSITGGGVVEEVTVIPCEDNRPSHPS